MASGGGVKETSFTGINGSEELHGITFLLEVDQVFVIAEDLDVGVCTPGFLNSFSCNLVLRLLHFLLFAFEESTPRPLNLDGGNVVHSESMILEKTSSKTHLIRSLDECRAEVTKAVLF